MADPQQSEAAPIGRISPDGDSGPIIPTLNPADSPYKPLELPQEQPPVQAPAPEQRPPENLGAVSHAGAAAYLIDQVLKGASHGAAVGMAYAADQYNKKLGALQGLYNDQAQQMYQIAKEGRAGAFTGPAGPDGKPTFVPSPEFKQAQQRMLASWQAMMQVVGQRIPQQKKGKGKSQAGQDDQTALLQQALDHKGDPNGALAATYALGLKVGPPVVHQVAGFLTPEYIAQQQTGARTQATQATAQATTADTGATVADINNKLAHAVQSGAPQDEIDKLIRQRDELSPTPKFPVGGLKRSGQGPDGKWYEWQEDQEGKEIPNTRRPLSTAGLGNKAPKLGWTKVDGKWGSQLYDPETNQPLPGTFDSSKLPPASALSLFPQEHTFHNFYVDADGNRKEFSATNTSQRDVPGGIGEGGTSSSAAPKAAKPTSSASPAASGNSSVRTIDYVGSKQYNALIKQATDAQKDFNSASTNLSTMLKTAADAKNGDGAAQVGIVSAYLKTVVGGQGTGVRITKPEWDAAVKTRPLLQGIQASFSPDGYLTGAVISRQQVDQMVNEVHQKTKSLFENVDAAKKRAQDQRVADMSAGGLGSKPAPAAPASQTNSIDDEILNLVKH